MQVIGALGVEHAKHMACRSFQRKKRAWELLWLLILKGSLHLAALPVVLTEVLTCDVMSHKGIKCYEMREGRY